MKIITPLGEREANKEIEELFNTLTTKPVEIEPNQYIYAHNIDGKIFAWKETEEEVVKWYEKDRQLCVLIKMKK